MFPAKNPPDLRNVREIHCTNSVKYFEAFSIIGNIQRKHSFQLKTICLRYNTRELYERL